ncbi:MAG: AEC family transporter, partial [Methyloceanibacter sp.]
SVGYQLQLSHVRGKMQPLIVGLAFKLVVGPALMLLLFMVALRPQGQTLSVTVFEAAMGPMIGASIVAMDHELDPPLVTLMVGIGIPLSFLTVPAWSHLLSFL